jgi:hypothetical protein
MIASGTSTCLQRIAQLNTRYKSVGEFLKVFATAIEILLTALFCTTQGSCWLGSRQGIHRRDRRVKHETPDSSGRRENVSESLRQTLELEAVTLVVESPVRLRKASERHYGGVDPLQSYEETND